MQDVAIIGAGELGGSLAHVLARRDVVRSICLIDDAGSIAAGKALDIMQASPIEQFSTAVSGTTDLSRVAGATIVVVADGAAQNQWSGEDGLQLFRQIGQLASGRMMICAGAAQRELVERSVRELRYSRQRIVGSAPEALAASLRSLIALESHTSARDVALTVLGVPPQHTVIPWETVTIAGFAAIDVLTEPVRRRIESRLAPLWPPGGHALATAAAECVAAVVGGSRKTLSCFVGPDDSMGRRQRAAALPVRFGVEGIKRIELPELDGRARVALETAMRM